MENEPEIPSLAGINKMMKDMAKAKKEKEELKASEKEKQEVVDQEVYRENLTNIHPSDEKKENEELENGDDSNLIEYQASEGEFDYLSEEYYDIMFKRINWYKQNAERLEPRHLKKLMQARATIAAYAVDYARAIKYYWAEYSNCHVIRSLNVKRRANKLQSVVDPQSSNGKTYTNARANEIATTENEQVYRDEYKYEALKDGMREVLRQVNGVLESMKQDIAEFRSIRGDNDKTEGDRE